MLKLINAIDMDYNNVLEYYNSFIKNGYDDINCYAIKLVSWNKNSYIDYLKNYDNNMYYLVDSNNENYIIGFGSIDNSKVNYHDDFFNIGNIGYGVRPNERNKGYESKILELLLKKCEEYGMSEVCVSCKEDNIASQKIILKHNGKFEQEFFECFEGYGLKYWIKLHPKIKNKVKRLLNKN